MSPRPAYFRVLATFARNSLVRNMAFRGNFLIETFTTIAWAAVNLAFYVLIFSFTSRIGEGWGKYQFFMFFGTGLLVNSLVMTLFMTNLDELSELIRTGALDFALLKPIDAQFLISLRRIDWSSLANFVVGLALLFYGLARADCRPGAATLVLYPFYVLCGVAVYYSFMLVLASASVWMGRNLTLLDFWFYITTFSRYPMEIFRGPVGGSCGGRSPSSCRCWSWSTCRRGWWRGRSGPPRRGSGPCPCSPCWPRWPAWPFGLDLPAGVGQLPQRQQLRSDDETRL